MSKFANFDLPHLHFDAPVEFRKFFGVRKLESRGYGVVCVILRLAVLVEHRLVTDRHRQTRTDTVRHRQTHGHGIYRESIARAVMIGACALCIR